MEMREGEAELAEVRLHYVEAGAGPMVVLLHGFPETWRCWRHQFEPLVEAGYRVVAPDLRGYNLSDRPKEVSAYRLPRLSRDVAELIEALGQEDGAPAAMVAGHDWGALVAWAVAMWEPQCLERLAILNVPHPAAFRRSLTMPRQWLRSYYVLAFQLPWLPEKILGLGDGWLARRSMRRDAVREEAFDEETMAHHREAFSRPGAWRGAINYYRALARHGVGAPMRTIEAPVLVIWGEKDAYLGPELAEPPRRWVPRQEVVRIPDASHWVNADAPERVNALLLEHLAQSPEVGLAAPANGA